jgi:hypothetical protein
MIENIESLMILDRLISLLEFDAVLVATKKSFKGKDKLLISNDKDNNTHFHKTEDCYQKFNSDLKEILGASQWFTVVKDMICGQTKLLSMDKLVAVNNAVEFGNKVLENYDEVRSRLTQRKRAYFGEFC